ncbi:MAG TPA: hypothetical protein VH912_32985 [Streptosporangiaceae bacterium]
MKGSISPLRLPVDAVRLAGRFVLPLTLLFAAGQLVRHLLIVAGIEVSHGRYQGVRDVIAALTVVLMVLTAMAVTVAMLFVVRPGLTAVRGPATASEERYIEVLGRALLPFTIIYFSWNLFYTDVGALLRADFVRNYQVGGGDLFAYSLSVALGVAAVTWVVRVLLERRYEKTSGHVVGVLTAVFEACFSFFAIFSLSRLAKQGAGWFADRSVWTDVKDVFAPLPDVPLGAAKDALLLPLLWLIIAAVVYGADLATHRAIVEGTRLEPLAGRVTGLRESRVRAIKFVTAEPRDKYVPLFAGLRLIWRAGIPVFAVFAFCYVGIGYVAQAVWLDVTEVIGPHGPYFWSAMIESVDFLRDLIQGVLQIALLAAAVDLMVARLGAPGIVGAGSASGGQAQPGKAEEGVSPGLAAD